MEQITISKKTAEILLQSLLDWTYYCDTMRAEARREIVALDEIVNVLDAEDKVLAFEERKRKEHEEYHKKLQKEAKK